MRFRGNSVIAAIGEIGQYSTASSWSVLQIFCWGWTLKWTLKVVPDIPYSISVFFFSGVFLLFWLFVHQEQRSFLIGCCLGHWTQYLNIILKKLGRLSYLEVHPRPWKCYTTSSLTMSPIPQCSLIFLLFYDHFWRYYHIWMFPRPWTYF